MITMVAFLRKGFSEFAGALLTRFDMRGAEVALGATQTLYGLGGALSHSYPGPPLIALMLGILTQIAAYSGPAYLRRVVNSLNCALWVFLGFHGVDSGFFHMVGLCFGLALTAALVSVRATAAYGTGPNHLDRRCSHDG